jgi:protease-4
LSLALASLTGSGKAPALSTLTSTLNAAAKDSALSGVVFDLSAFSLTMNQAQEIGALMTNLRHAGKRVAVYAAEFDTPTYLLASYADTVIMPEQGDVLIPGVGLQMVFFAGTLEKLHMSADFVQIGKFKGAEEPFTRKSASPEYRAQIEKLVDGMYTQLVSTLATNRPNVKEADVKKIIDEAWLSGKRAKEAGLVDQTLSRDKLEGWINSQFPAGANIVDNYGEPKKESIDLSSPFAIFSLLGGSDKPRGSSLPAIAVVYATGEINGDTPGTEGSTEVVTPGGIRKAVQKALDDDRVKAIVLRVDSPGGSAAASDEIWSVLKEADKKKPVTVSMGQFAASGGYYISCAGRRITADPATITGSIGVVGGKVVLKGLLDWAGLNIEPIERGQHAEMMSALRPYTDEERAFIKKSMEEVYGVFTSRVAAARGEKVAHLEEVAQGRLFTGQQAKDAGLVDDVGTLNDTIKTAAKTAGLGESYQVLILPQPKTLADILQEAFADAKLPIISSDLRFDAVSEAISALPPEVRKPTQQALHSLQMLQSERIMLTMPAGLVESHR